MHKFHRFRVMLILIVRVHREIQATWLKKSCNCQEKLWAYLKKRVMMPITFLREEKIRIKIRLNETPSKLLKLVNWTRAMFQGLILVRQTEVLLLTKLNRYNRLVAISAIRILIQILLSKDLSLQKWLSKEVIKQTES